MSITKITLPEGCGNLGVKNGVGGGGGGVGTHQFYIPHNDVFHDETPTMIYPNK